MGMLPLRRVALFEAFVGFCGKDVAPGLPDDGKWNALDETPGTQVDIPDGPTGTWYTVKINSQTIGWFREDYLRLKTCDNKGQALKETYNDDTKHFIRYVCVHSVHRTSGRVGMLWTEPG